MSKFLFAVIVAFLSSSCSVAWCNTFVVGESSDPRVQPRDAAHSGGGATQPVSVPSDTFTVLTPSGYSPDDGTSCSIDGLPSPKCSLTNTSGHTWATLALTVTPGQPFDSCDFDVDLFGGCEVIQQGGSSLESVIDFYGGNGILNGESFAISFDGWAANTTLTGVADAPEPALEPVLALFALTGLVVKFRSSLRPGK